MGIRILGVHVAQEAGGAGTTRARLWPGIVRMWEGKVVCVWQERDGEVWVRHRPRSVQCDGHEKKRKMSVAYSGRWTLCATGLVMLT